MKAILFDRFYQRRWSLILFLPIALALTYWATTLGGSALAFTYLALVVYWNGMIKDIGPSLKWKLLWSLPLQGEKIIAGLTVSHLIYGWGVNILLYLFIRIFTAFSPAYLLLACAASLITDVLLIGLELIPKGTAFLSLLWLLLIALFPIVLLNYDVTALLDKYFALSLPLQIFPALLVYLAGLWIILLLYRRFRLRWDNVG